MHALFHRFCRHRPSWALQLALLFKVLPASAFWLLGFSAADTLPAGGLGVIAGTGGQFSRVGSPSQDSSSVFIPHAGFRWGLSDDVDVGYRLVQVTLPFSALGPTLGGEFDGKYRISDPAAANQWAILAGLAYAHVEISGQSKTALSPGVDLISSRVMTDRYTLFADFRYVATAIPTAAGGQALNHFSTGGVGGGVKIRLTPQASLVPELGLFHLQGQVQGKAVAGHAAQVGVVLAMRIW